MKNYRTRNTLLATLVATILLVLISFTGCSQPTVDEDVWKAYNLEGTDITISSPVEPELVLSETRSPQRRIYEFPQLEAVARLAAGRIEIEKSDARAQQAVDLKTIPEALVKMANLPTPLGYSLEVSEASETKVTFSRTLEGNVRPTILAGCVTLTQDRKSYLFMFGLTESPESSGKIIKAMQSASMQGQECAEAAASIQHWSDRISDKKKQDNFFYIGLIATGVISILAFIWSLIRDRRKYRLNLAPEHAAPAQPPSADRVHTFSQLTFSIGRLTFVFGLIGTPMVAALISGPIAIGFDFRGMFSLVLPLVTGTTILSILIHFRLRNSNAALHHSCVLAPLAFCIFLPALFLNSGDPQRTLNSSPVRDLSVALIILTSFGLSAISIIVALVARVPSERTSEQFKGKD